MSDIHDDLDELGQRLWPDTAHLRPRPSDLRQGPSRRHRATFAAGAMCALVVAAVVLVNHRAGGSPGGEAAPDHPGSPVSWVADAAPDVAQPFTVAGVPPCSAAELRVQGQIPTGSPFISPPTDLALWTIGVFDAGSTPCFLSPTVDVTFTTASGGALPLTRRPYGDDIAYLVPAGSPARTGFAREVTANVRTFGSCPAQQVTALTFTLAAGLGSITLDAPPPPYGTGGRPCGGGRSEYDALMLSGLGFEGAMTPASTTSSIQAPSVASPGARMRFLVTVANAPAPPDCQGTDCPARVGVLSFDPCPTYHEELEGVGGSFHTYRLNCAVARPVTAGSMETFEMYIEVPASAVPGPAVLAWTMDGPRGLYQPARAVIEIGAATKSTPTPDPCLTQQRPVSMEYRPELRASVPVPSGWGAGEDEGTSFTTMTPPCVIVHGPRFTVERLDATTVPATLQSRCALSGSAASGQPSSTPAPSGALAASQGPMDIAGHAGSYQYLCQPRTFIGAEWTVLIPESTGAGVWRLTYLGAADLDEGALAGQFEAVLQAFQP